MVRLFLKKKITLLSMIVVTWAIQMEGEVQGQPQGNPGVTGPPEKTGP